MAHPQQREFFEATRERFPQYFGKVTVIEIGSLDINGTVRDFFPDALHYVGVDLEEGKGVDLVAQGQEVDLPNRSFDVAVSAECFEHNPFWLETFVNMYRMADKLVMFTCASTGRPEHGTSRTTPENSPFTVKQWDYYRNLTASDFYEALDISAMFSHHKFEYNPTSCDLYFWGIVA